MTTYAPPPGVDPDFDEIWERVKAARSDDGLSDEEAREILAENLTRVQGRQFKGAPAGPPLDDEPEVSVEAAPRALVIPKRPADPYWWDDPADAEMMEHFILTRRSLGNAFHGALLIVGHAGTGKTMGVQQAVRRVNEKHQLNLRLTKMDAATVTDPQKWFGRREVDKSGTHYIKSDFVEAVERGDVILIDDISRIHPTIANPLFPIFDGSQALTLSDLNVTIKVAPETTFIWTSNEGAMYGGVHRLDWAFRERAPFTIERTFPPRDDEIRVVTTHTGCDIDGASVLVDIAERTRTMFNAGDLRAQISTRMLVAAGWLVASGYTEREALRYSAIPSFDGNANGLVGEESDRRKVELLIQGKLGR